MEEEKHIHKKNTFFSKHMPLMVIFCALIVTAAGILTLTKNDILDSLNQQSAPEENVIYLAEKGNEKVLYYRYADMLIEHKKPTRTVGHYVAYEKPYNIKEDPNKFVDFNELKNPKKLFSFEGHPGIQNYLLSADKKYLLLSYVAGKTDTTNYIYQIDLNNLKNRNIWEHELRSGNHPYNSGIAYIMHFIPNKYVVLAIIKNTPPPDALPEGVLVKNLQSGKEKVLGGVGDVTIDAKKKEVSFKKLQKTPVPCEKDDPDCFATDTYKYEFKPGGDPVIEPLP